MIYYCPRTQVYAQHICHETKSNRDRVNPNFEDLHIYHFVPYNYSMTFSRVLHSLKGTKKYYFIFLTHFPHPFIHSLTFD